MWELLACLPLRLLLLSVSEVPVEEEGMRAGPIDLVQLWHVAQVAQNETERSQERGGLDTGTLSALSNLWNLLLVCK